MKRVTAQIINPITNIKQELSICEPVKEGSEIDNVLLRFGISLSVLDIISRTYRCQNFIWNCKRR